MSAAKHTPGPVFALAGQLVSEPKHAMRILVTAQRDGKEWLVPQARNVHAKLSRAALAKATGSAQ